MKLYMYVHNSCPIWCLIFDYLLWEYIMPVRQNMLFKNKIKFVKNIVKFLITIRHDYITIVYIKIILYKYYTIMHNIYYVYIRNKSQCTINTVHLLIFYQMLHLKFHNRDNRVSLQC